MICRYCGADNNENRRICKGCNRPLYDDISIDSQESMPPDNGYYDIPPKKKNTLLWICVGAGAVAVLAIVVAGILLFRSETTSKKYTSKLSEAEKYVASLDYDSAITLYNEAIELAPDNVTAYVNLANVYIAMNNLAKAQEIAMKGFEKTKDNKLQDLVNRLFGNATENTDNEISVNTDLLKKLTGEGYNDIINNYGKTSVSQENGYTKLVCQSINCSLYYSASNVEANTGQPKENAFPEYIIVNDISLIIKNYNGYLSAQTLSELFKNTTKVVMTDGKQCVSIDYLNSNISIESDNQGNITAAAPYIKIVLSADNSDSDLNALKGTATGTIMTASDKQALAGVHIAARQGADVKKGTVVAETDTDSKGAYTLNLKEGKYTLCVSKKGYNDQYFNITVNKGMTMPGQNYVMSEADTSDDLILVLEWGSTPADLDLHIQGQTERGTFVSIFGYKEKNMQQSENGQVIASLDKNEKNGNGKETITVKKSAVSGKYAVHIHDQTNRNSRDTTSLSQSGAVLKVYLPGETTPHIYNVPTNKAATCWYPCNITDGKITVPSESSQMVYSTIG